MHYTASFSDFLAAMSSDSGEALSCMFYMDESCLIGCTRNNGSITMWDLRAGSAAVQSYNNSAQQSNQTWTCHKLNRSSSLVDGLLLQTSSDGDIVLRDIRNARRDVLQTTIEQKFPKPFQDFMTVGVGTQSQVEFGHRGVYDQSKVDLEYPGSR